MQTIVTDKEVPAVAKRQRTTTRIQKETTNSVLCELVDWESVKDEEQIHRALQIVENQAKQIRDTLTTTTTEDPSIRWPLHQLDEHVRIGATHPLHKAVDALLQCLPDSEWHIDKAGNRMFRNDGGLWATLCDISRLPVTNQAEYADKRLKMVDVRRKFQQWLESEYLADSESGEKETFATRLGRLFSKLSVAGIPVSTRKKQPHSKPIMSVVKDQTTEKVDFQFNGSWLTADFCADEFNLDDTSLSRWAINGCPYLDGRKLRRLKFPPDQPRWCYHRVDIENIDSALNDDD